jgi:hypothetical protein
MPSEQTLPLLEVLKLIQKYNRDEIMKSILNDILTVLLQYGANPNKKDPLTGMTPSEYARKNNMNQQQDILSKPYVIEIK